MPETPLLQVRGLQKHFPVWRRDGLRSRRELVRAVDGINLDVHPGETLGLVGESGCGKSTAGRAILQLIRPTAGSVLYRTESGDEYNLPDMRGEALRRLRRELGIVFQDPMSALDPRMTVGEIIAEPLRAHERLKASELDDRVRDLLQQVGLPDAAKLRFPHAFSGGQRQRIGIARALALKPRFVVLDEPISALDVSVRAQILNLLTDLQEQLQPAYLFIAHDLMVVQHFCSRVAVMYLGVIVEEGPARSLFQSPLHPYTRALTAAIPSPDPEKRSERALLSGDVPTAIQAPSGCRFHTRCPLAQPRCADETPLLRDAGEGRKVACHFA
jgi:oligopeptide/dipeptide ABC transporter ATP-binding protein